MQQEGPLTPYEVFCNHCRVTFPAGTRRCVHCGERIGGERFRPALRFHPGGENDALEEEVTGRGSGFSPLTLIWVVLLLGGYLYRSCAS